MNNMVNGDPVYILRYKYDSGYRFLAFDYFSNEDTDFRIKTLINGNDQPVAVVSTPGKQKSLISTNNISHLFLLREHKLPFYKRISDNPRRQDKALVVAKDKLQVKINDAITLDIELEDGNKAVEYQDSIAIFSSQKNKTRKIKEIRLIPNGIVMANDDIIETMVFDDEGNVVNHIEASNLSLPSLLDSTFFEPLNGLPGNVYDQKYNYSLTYDDHGILKSGIINKDTRDEHKYDIDYHDIDLENGRLIQSIHHLFLDNFDVSKYFNDDLTILDKLILYDNGDVEYIREVFNNVKIYEYHTDEEIKDGFESFDERIVEDY